MNHNEANSSFFWLVLIAFVVSLAARRLRVPYALALVMTGLVIGFGRLMPQVHLEPSLIFTVFLPPLLFEAAIHLRLGELRRNWAPIAIYALAGTLASTFLVGTLASLLLHLPLATALVFGALISATDPISVLAIFKRLGAGRRLTLIMEAESLFNDGVAVVLFTVLTGAALGGSLSLVGATGQFVQLVGGGLLLGSCIALLATRVHLELDDHLVEITLTTIVAFGSYLAAEALHFSGVMAVVAAGLVIGNFGQQAMSPGTRLSVTSFWEYAGFVANSLIFLLVGIEAAYLNWADNFGVALGAAALVLVGRSVIYPLSLGVNRLGGAVPLAWQHILVWGGLRGALSMALVLGLDARFPHRPTLIAATFGAVLFSLLAQGLTVGPLLKRLGLIGERTFGARDERRLSSEIAATQAALQTLERVRQEEAYPAWMIATLSSDYARRLTLLEDSLQLLTPLHELSEEREVAEVRALALAAEKDVFQGAQRQGLLDDDDWNQIAARIDAELFALKLK